MKPSNNLTTPRQAAAAIGVSYPTSKQWILSGKLKTIKTAGGHHRISNSEIARDLQLPASSPEKSARKSSRDGSARNQLIGTIVEIEIRGLRNAVEPPSTGI
jgi:excisionase family DNA binding protein